MIPERILCSVIRLDPSFQIYKNSQVRFYSTWEFLYRFTLRGCSLQLCFDWSMQ